MMKKRLWVGCIAIVLGLFVYGQAAGPQQQASGAVSPSVSTQRALLDQYCVSCHNQRLRTAGLALDALDLTQVGSNAAVWEKVVRKLRAGVMPPAGARRPDRATHEALTLWLETEIDRNAAARLNPGTTGVHRLNRTEYANAIRDLLALEIDATALLPADDSSYGFDNMAGALSVSPALLEAYVAAAAKISRLAIGHSTAPAANRYGTALDTTQNYHIAGLPFGTRGGMLIRHTFPADGEYTFGIESTPVGDIVRGEQLELIIDGQRVHLFDWDAERAIVGRFPLLTNNDIENKMEVRIPVKAGARTVGVTFIATNYRPNSDLNKHLLRTTHHTFGLPGVTQLPHVGNVVITGPYNATVPEDTSSRKRIFTCRPATAGEEASCAREILSTLVRRAYRRPVIAEDLEVLMGFYQTGRDKGNFDDGIEMALRRVIADPEFIFRMEGQPANLAAGAAYRISDLELASRLSFFLWSSIPDDELINVASQGKLKDPAVLEQQVRRMLADSRSEALVDNFAAQWLHLRNLPIAVRKVEQFPDFDENLREAFRRETELLFDSIMREDRNVVDLLTADYTFVDQRLAKHYGMPNVYGSQFRRVTLAADNPRRGLGLLGHGSMLTVTSLADRTSPVARGKWILENILGTPPPNPPANVPPLEKSDKDGGRAMSLRERLEQHRANPACVSCHKLMDPIGFSLENFDAEGKWRTRDGVVPVDALSELFDGATVSSPMTLRQALLRYSPQFVRTITERLLTYGLGRGVEYYDMPTVRSIVRTAEANNNRFSAIVMGIVKSAPFQMKANVEQTVVRD